MKPMIFKTFDIHESSNGFKEGAIPEYINDDLAYSEIRRYSELLFILANPKK